MARLLLLLVLALAALVPAAAQAAVPAGRDVDARSTSTDARRRAAARRHPAPQGRARDAKTPVIAIVSPYLGHAADGIPSDRFKDLFDGAKVFERGYTVVMVDLRGSGGSSGLPRHPRARRADRHQDRGRVGRARSRGRPAASACTASPTTATPASPAPRIRPKGLHAVVAQQVVGDRYSGSYSGGVRYLQSLAYPSVSYGTQAEGGWTEQDDEQYVINSLQPQRRLPGRPRRPLRPRPEHGVLAGRATSSPRARARPCRSS